MEKIKKIFKKIRRYYRKRKLYKLAEADASILCGRHFRALPEEIYIEGDKEVMLRETQRVLHEFKRECGEWHSVKEKDKDSSVK